MRLAVAATAMSLAVHGVLLVALQHYPPISYPSMSAPPGPGVTVYLLSSTSRPETTPRPAEDPEISNTEESGEAVGRGVAAEVEGRQEKPGAESAEPAEPHISKVAPALTTDAAPGSGAPVRGDRFLTGESHGLDLPPQLLTAITPSYPSGARRRGQEGTVTLLVRLNNQGQVLKVDLQGSSGVAALDTAAVRAAEEATFRPRIEGGVSVAASVRVRVVFDLTSASD
ncbi:MAG: energy transducer TonB [Spirochaetota bacterium]